MTIRRPDRKPHPPGSDLGDIVLPAPDAVGHVALEAALGTRRSRREFRRGALPLEALGQILWAAQGITGPDGGRTAPSAGALYPLELHVAAGDVERLPAGIYRYLPEGHRLRVGVRGDLRASLAEACWGQRWVATAPLLLAAAAVPGRTTGTYGARGRRYVAMEAGHAAQNVHLQAEALGLGTVVVGAFEDRAVRKALGLPREEEPLWLMPVGRPA